MKTEFITSMKVIVVNLEGALKEMEKTYKGLSQADEDGEYSATTDYLEFEIRDLKHLISKYRHMIELNEGR